MKSFANIIKAISMAAAATIGFAAMASTKDVSINSDGEWKTTITVSYGQAYTFWLTGCNSDMYMDLSVEGTYTYKEDGDTYEDFFYPSGSASIENSSGGYDVYVGIAAEDWDGVPSSVKSIKFTVYVTGFYDEEVKANNKCKLNYSSGYSVPDDEPIVVDPTGTINNPKSITVKETTTPATGATMTDCEPSDESTGVYYITTSTLTAGHKYFFGIDNGSGMAISKTTGGENLFENEECSKEYYAWESCSEAYSFLPPETAVYYIMVTTENAFNFYSAALPAWKPTQHESTEIAVGETSDAFAPGYMCDPEGTSYDEVIDQQLFAVTGYVKGESYLFTTEGANADLLMRVYDASGKILASNLRTGDSSCEVQCAWTATANYSKNSGIYVGVCQVLADGETPSAGEVTLKIAKVETETTLENLLVTTSGMVEQPSGENNLSGTCWVNTFAIAARAGVTYNVKTAAEDDAAHGLELGCRVYTLNGTRATELTAAKGGLSGNIDRSGGGVEFTPTAHGTVYIDVYVADGEWGSGTGLEYGPYTATATAVGDYGVLTVEMSGASQSLMGWKLLKFNGKAISKPAEVVYPAGASTILAAGTYAVMAQTVKGFTKTDTTAGFTNVVIVSGQQTTASYKYTDEKDPLDDYPTGSYSAQKKYAPTKISPSAKGVSESHSLWTDDVADWFKFTATAGTYYKFQFTEKTGNPKMTIYGPGGWEDECEYVLDRDQTECVQIKAAKGDYYLKVSHDDQYAVSDSSYTLLATSANPGMIKLDKAAVSVKEDARYVDVGVSRSAKDGIVRLKFRTAAATAMPGEDYFPTNGVITWAANDSAKKTVRVFLIPDLVATYEGANKSFNVVFETFTEGEGLAENEYIPEFATDTKTKLPVDTCVVTLTETAKAVPGTIQAADAADVKKPVYNVVAGETVTVPFVRTVGCNGNVGVKVETVKGTVCNKTGETDFVPVTTNLVWLDGEDEEQLVKIVTKSNSTDYTATKTFTLKLSALTSAKTDPVQYTKPTLAASTVTINILNDKFASTMAVYAKTVTAATDGYTIKEGKAGTWMVRDDGSFFAPNGGDLTFTFSTTGTFKYTVDGVEYTFTPTAKQKTLTVKGAREFKVDGYELDGEIVELRQGVKYSETLGDGSTKFAASGLPTGVSVKQDKTTKVWTVEGVPSKYGIFQTVITETYGAQVVDTRTMCYKIAAEGTAAGTFNGLATTFDTDNSLQSMASVSITAAIGGKLSASVSIGGKKYSFTDTGYSYTYGGTDDEFDPPMVVAELIQLQKVTNASKKQITLTNYLYYTACDLPETNAGGWYREATVEIQMSALPDLKGTGYQEDVWYEGKIYRDNAKISAWVAEAAEFAGYYTVALVNSDAQTGEPRGNGYIGLTLDAKGKAKVTGALPDGTAISASATAALVDNDGTVSVRVPLYACKDPYLFGGWLAIAVNGDGVAVAMLEAPDTDVVWKNDNAAYTMDGEYGFDLRLYPVGGYYSSVMNLRRYYLENEFFVSLANRDDDLEELAATLPDGYEFVADPDGQSLIIDGSKDNGTISVDKQVLAKDENKLNDFAASVNPANVSVTFKHATGIMSGTFDLWYQGVNAKGATEQKSYSKLKYAAIHVMNCEDNGYLDYETALTGYYIVPLTLSETGSNGKTVTRKYNASYRFDVKAESVERDWTEVTP